MIREDAKPTSLNLLISPDIILKNLIDKLKNENPKLLFDFILAAYDGSDRKILELVNNEIAPKLRKEIERLNKLEPKTKYENVYYV